MTRLAARARPAWVCLALVFILVSGAGGENAWGWYKHVTLMPSIMRGVSPALAGKLSAPFKPICGPGAAFRWQELALSLHLNAGAQLPPFSEEACQKGTTALAILSEGIFTDDPDAGIDRDLPASEDPSGDRRWMGGETGPSSQGFRHMYFAGWKLAAPFATFQYPSREMGQALARADLMARTAKKLLSSGEIAWGTRVLSWALHYVQDLAQPFHTVQWPGIRMIPWYSGVGWPPRSALERLVADSMRANTNFHFAYEGYVLDQMTQAAATPLKQCLAEKGLSPGRGLSAQSSVSSPLELARSVSEDSVALAPELGSALIGYFTLQLKQPSVDLRKNEGSPNYREFATRPDLAPVRRELERVSCEALSEAAVGSRRLIEWAFSE